MLFGQWSARKSLRDLTFSLSRPGHKLDHLGLSPVQRYALADAHEHRLAEIFEKTYSKRLARLSAEMACHQQINPEIKIIDAITIDLCASVFPWANFRLSRGVIFRLPFIIPIN